MIKKSLILLSIFSLVGCNDNKESVTTSPTPEYKEPKIILFIKFKLDIIFTFRVKE